MGNRKILLGWKGIFCNEGKFVDAEDGLSYVFDQIGIMAFNHDAPDAAMFLEDLLEWYFSGNWIEVYEEDDNA